MASVQDLVLPSQQTSTTAALAAAARPQPCASPPYLRNSRSRHSPLPHQPAQPSTAAHSAATPPTSTTAREQEEGTNKRDLVMCAVRCGSAVQRFSGSAFQRFSGSALESIPALGMRLSVRSRRWQSECFYCRLRRNTASSLFLCQRIEIRTKTYIRFSTMIFSTMVIFNTYFTSTIYFRLSEKAIIEVPLFHTVHFYIQLFHTWIQCPVKACEPSIILLLKSCYKEYGCSEAYYVITSLQQLPIAF